MDVYGADKEEIDVENDSGTDHEIHCYCGGRSEDPNFVFCEECRTWQHMECVGFDASTEGDSGYNCPTCASKKELLGIKATLVVCPDTILEQWREEIVKHVQLALYH